MEIRTDKNGGFITLDAIPNMKYTAKVCGSIDAHRYS